MSLGDVARWLSDTRRTVVASEAVGAGGTVTTVGPATIVARPGAGGPPGPGARPSDEMPRGNRSQIPGSGSLNTGPPLPPGNSGGPPGGLAGPPGPPPDLAFGGLQGLGGVPNPRRRWILTEAAQPPVTPAGVDAEASSRLTELLATDLGVEAQRVRLYVRKAGFFGDNGVPIDQDEIRLRQGFIAGIERSQGHWRIVENPPAGFTDLFQRRELWEFA